MNLVPPEWMLREADRNPVVQGYLRLGYRVGYDSKLIDSLAQELAAQNADLVAKLTTLATNASPPIVVFKEKP